MTKLIQSCLVSCLVLSLVLVNVSGLFWRQSNCNNDRQVILNTGFAELIFLFIFFTLQCPDIKRSTCRNCFLGFIGIPSVTGHYIGFENLHFTKPSQKSNIVPNLHFTKPSLNQTLWVKLTLNQYILTISNIVPCLYQQTYISPISVNF